MRTSTGLSTEVVYIFNSMLRKLAKTFKPEHMAAIFESPAKPIAKRSSPSTKPTARKPRPI